MDLTLLLYLKNSAITRLKVYCYYCMRKHGEFDIAQPPEHDV